MDYWNALFAKDYKHGRHSTVFKVDYSILTSIHMMLDTYETPTFTHTHRTAYWQTPVWSECTLVWKKPQLSGLMGVACEHLGGHRVSVEYVYRASVGLAKSTTGHVSVLDGHGLEDVWPALLICFLLIQKIIQRYMHKRVNVIGLAATCSRCNRWWTDVNKICIWRLKKYSIGIARHFNV